MNKTAVVRSFTCTCNTRWICACLVNALQFARAFTLDTGRPVSVLCQTDSGEVEAARHNGWSARD
jgi:hypothetical protein